MPYDVVVIEAYNEAKKKGSIAKFLRQGVTIPRSVSKYYRLKESGYKEREKIITFEVADAARI